MTPGVQQGDGIATVNSHASLSDLAKTIAGLIPEPAGDSAVFHSRAKTALKAGLVSMVDLRDSGFLVLDETTLSEHLMLDHMERMAFDERLRESTKQEVLAYLNSLPLWKPPSERVIPGSSDVAPIHEEALRQHAFAIMYWGRVRCTFSSRAATQ